MYFVRQQSQHCKSDMAQVRVGLIGTTCFRCDIYNRWGRLLYVWEDPDSGWDGTIQRTGQRVSDGVYYWLLSYCDYAGLTKRDAGYVHVMGRGY